MDNTFINTTFSENFLDKDAPQEDTEDTSDDINNTFLLMAPKNAIRSIKKDTPVKSDINRIGAKWTNEEDSQLLDELEQKRKISEIANIHGRTITSIKYRLYHHAYKKMNEQDSTIDELVKFTGLDINELKEGLDKMKLKDSNKKTTRRTEESSIRRSSELGGINESNYNRTDNKKSIEDITKNMEIMKEDIAKIKNDLCNVKKNMQEFKNIIKNMLEMNNRK